MIATRAARDLFRTVALTCVLVLIAAIVVWWVFFGTGSRRISAYFDQAIGVYAGSKVDVLGVPVGRVDAVVPAGTRVRVDMSVDRSVSIPANADAVVVAPSVVSDRYVQLAPVYVGGPRISDNAVIPVSRTATPVELDELYQSLNKVSTDLGPNGANAHGALSDLLDTAAANLAGNGPNLHDTITELSQLTGTLDANKANLFSTVDNLATFTTTLADGDASVRRLSRLLDDVAGFLAGQRGNLAAAVSELGSALGRVQAFISDNRAAIKSNVDNLASVTEVLVEERSALAEVLDDAPLVLSNGINTYNAASGTLDGRADINELAQPPMVGVCKLLEQVSPNTIPGPIASTCAQLAPVVQGLVPLPSPAQVVRSLNQGTLPPLPLPIAGVVYGTG